ncbi:hypothetical protein LPJ66_002050 [Kickxella alabastrina]|uniref:Uncharacterized protein n=1 Tax=Kickxella alabastrina TaxID=61397 RepID=A0ACC1IRJ4_9FUNG|nr:hypothetical protein LPJ66_002050 [Kickxella alabastrina]
MVFHSPYPAIAELPTQDLPSFVFEYADKYSLFGRNPELVALSEGSVSLTFAELRQTASRFASGLINNLKLQRGDIILVLLPNTVYYVSIVLGAQMAGLVCTTANPEYIESEVAHVVGLCKPKAVITVAANVALVQGSLLVSGVVVPRERILTLDGGPENNFTVILSDQPYEQMRITTQKEAQETPAFIVLSSGTTGLSKGVVLSHSNVIANMLQNTIVEEYDSSVCLANITVKNRALISCLPCFHIYGLVIMLLYSVAKGHHQVVMPKYDLELFCQLVAKHKAASAHLVPLIIIQLAKNPIVNNYDLSSLVYILSGAAPLTNETQSEIQRRLGCHVMQAYGMSEASPVTHRGPTDGVPVGSVGYLLPSMQCKVIDDQGNELGVGEAGEICTRGPNIMLGYLNDPQATAQTIDKDGFIHSGDIGYVNSRGCYFISDRKKELIKYKAFQIAPAEIEGILVAHPAVLDAAVIPVFDHAQETEVPKAFVVIRPGLMHPDIADEVKEWLTFRVVHYKTLRGGVEVIDVIPKTASGKILRRVLKEREATKLKQQSLWPKL